MRNFQNHNLDLWLPFCLKSLDVIRCTFACWRRSPMSNIKSVTNMTTTGAVLGAVLVEMRTIAGMKQVRLAEKVGVGPSTWSRIEKGESGLSIDQLKAAADALGNTPWDILEVADAAGKSISDHGIKVESTQLSPKDLAKQETEKNNESVVKDMVAAGVAANVVIPIVGTALFSLVSSVLSQFWDPLPHTCPNCKSTTAKTPCELQELFGLRNSSKGSTHQSWCKNCRNR